MTTNIGLIGCGGISKHHVNGYLKLEDVHVTAVSDVVAENAQARSEQAGGAQIYSDFNELVQQADIDAVDICLPHHLHKAAIIAAASAKKHILCEKPLCLTIAEANEIEKAVRENGVTLMCAHNQLFLPPVARAKQMLQNGELGQVYELRTTDSFYHSFNLESIGWRAHRSMSGGGELIDTGYHPTYLLLYLANSVPTEVTSMISNHRLHFMEGEDSGQVLVRFADGSVGNIVTSWAYEPASITEKFSVVAEKGYLYSYGADLFYRQRGSDEQKIELSWINTFDAEIADFISCLREKRRPINTEVEGTNVLRVILGAYKSSEEKRTIVLKDLE